MLCVRLSRVGLAQDLADGQFRRRRDEARLREYEGLGGRISGKKKRFLRPLENFISTVTL